MYTRISAILCPNTTDRCPARISHKHSARISRRYSARKACRHSARIFCWRTHCRGWGSGWNHRPLGLAQAITPFNSNISRCLACLCVEIHCVVIRHDHVSHIALGEVFKYTNSRASGRNQTSFISGETYPQELWAEPLGVEICWNGS